MLFNYDFLKDNNSLCVTTTNPIINSIRIAKGVFNHLNVLNILGYYTNKTIPEGSSAWTDNTVINVTFNGTLDGGNISELIANVKFLAIQRKEEGSNTWITLDRIYKDEYGGINANFTMYDTYNEYGKKYLYQIVPVDNQGNYGTAIQQESLSLFNNAYIADASHIYKITYDYQLSNNRVQKNTMYEPFGARYPFVAYNAETNYDNGSVTAILLQDTSIESSQLDRTAQTKLVREFNSWLTNGRPKILKDFNGQFKIITIVDSISNNYYKELGNGLASTTFNFIEVGELTQDYLDKLGMSTFPKEYHES